MRADDSSYRSAEADELLTPQHRGAESALESYLHALKAHGVVFTLVTLATVVAAITWTAGRTPAYEATARILVSPVSGDDRTFVGVQVVRDSGDPTRTVQTAATLVESHEAAVRTARLLQPASSPGYVAAAITVEPLGQSNVLAVRAQGDSPERAADIATAYASAALQVRSEAVRSQIARLIPDLQSQQRALESASPTAAGELAARIIQLRASREQGDPTLSLEQPASPGTLVGASRSLIVVLSLLAGIAIAAAAAVLLELARTRVRDVDEARALFPLPVLARVPRLTARERHAASNGSLRLAGPVQRAYQAVYLQLADEGDGRAIMLTSASTGDGKTTSAVRLAGCMAFAGKRVILMDCDLRAPRAGRMLGLIDGDPIRDLSDPPATLERALAPVPGVALSVLTLGPVPAAPGMLESLVDRLPDLVREARSRADFVVIDTPPLGEVSDALPLLRAVDDVVIVTRPGRTDRRAYEAMRDLMHRMRAHVRGLVVVGVAPDVPSAYLRRSAAEDRDVTSGGGAESRVER